MMLTTGQRILLCCWMLLVACHHCGGSKVVVLPLEEAKSLADGVTITTTQQEEDAVVLGHSTLRRRRLQADDYDDGAGDNNNNNNNEPNDSNENEPTKEEEEEEEEGDEPNEGDMPPLPIENVNDPEEKEEEEDEANDFVVDKVEREDEEETQEVSNHPPGDEAEKQEEEEEEEDEKNESEQDQGEYDITDPDEEEPNQDVGSNEQDAGHDEQDQQWSGETPTADGDDYVDPQQQRPVRFQRPGADKARAYRKDSLTPELRAKIQKKLDENKAARRDRRGFLIMERKERQQQQQQNFQQPPPLRRPGQGQAAIVPENPREGATDTMRAFQPGTLEYKQRREEVLKRVELTNGKRARLALQLKMEQMDKIRAAQNSTRTITLISEKGVGGPVNNKGRYTPFTKALPKAKFVEKVPVVKRLVKKMGYEEALMLDTTLSFLQGLRYGVYKSSGPLTLTKKRALVEWFELLSVSLPQEWGIHEILDDFSDNIEDIAQKESSLVALVNQHKPSRTTWSPACKQGKSSPMSGFTCGFWKLLHVSTVGLAEHRGGHGLIESGIRNSKTRTFTPKEAADTMKNYIQHFYLSGDYAKQFVAEYNDCTLFSRCNRLADDSSVTDADWKEVGKWLWEVHNHISVKVLLERKDNEKNRYGLTVRSTEQHDVIAALWPTVDMCSQCFNGDGSWNEDAVFLYLERTFWPPSVLDPQSARLLKFEDEFRAQGTGFTMVLAFVGLILVFVMRQSLSKKSLDQTIIMARKAMVTKGSVGAKKRSV